MGEHLVISSIKDRDKQSQITRVLVQHPAINAVDVQNHLRRLPYKLPALQDPDRLTDLQTRLESLGCEVYRLAERVPAAPDSPPRKPQPTPAAVDKKPAMVNLRPKIEAEDSATPGTTSSEVAASAIETQDSSPRRISPQKWLGALALSLILVLFYWMGREKEKEAKHVRESHHGGAAFPEANEGGSPGDAGEGGQPGPSKSRAENLFKLAQQEADLSRKEQLLEKSTSANRYHTGAWNEWVRTLLKSGHQEKSDEIRRLAFQHNDKTRAVLKSIAEKFGSPEQPFDLSEEHFQIEIQMYPETAGAVEEKGLLLYNQVAEQFGARRLTFILKDGTGQDYEIDVPPQKGQLNRDRFRHFFHSR